MKKPILLAVVSTSVVGLAMFAGCGSSSSPSNPTDAGGDHTGSSSGASGSSSGSSGGSSGSSSGSSGSSSGSEGGTPPLPPTLGTQIDRMGRAAINTALTGTFDPNCTKATCPAKDTYNANSTQSTWVTQYQAGMEAYLAIYDSLDNVCGNQAGYATPASATSYATLSGVLANDVLWLNTSVATCQQYLSIELGALGVTNTDCGGRTLTENTLDLTYNILAGTLTPATLPANPGPAVNGSTAATEAPSSTFPYLAAPQ
jgi:hypothetical protein